MKVLNERDKFLSDYEVLDYLNEIKANYNWTFQGEEELKNNKHKKRFTACGLDLEVITRDVLSYLSKSPCASIDSAVKFQELMTFLNTLELMKVEKLQIINTLPRSMVHLYALVEECDLRFDEEKCEGILNKICELFPVEEEEEEEEEEEGNNNGEQESQREGEEDEQFESADDTQME